MLNLVKDNQAPLQPVDHIEFECEFCHQDYISGHLCEEALKAWGLNHQQELFCKYYASDKEFFGNGTQAYIEAYDIDLSRPGAYAGARANASRLLTLDNILKRINYYLELGSLNDVSVDKELLFVIRQHADLSSKVAAIREYNKLKQRVTEKVDVTSKGDKVVSINYIVPNDPNSKTGAEAASSVPST